MFNTTRRETISDSLITNDIFLKLLNFVLSKANDVDNLSQTEIVNILLPKKISNVTMAKVINALLPDAQATKGSIASLIRHIKSKDTLIDELLKDIGDV